MSSNPATKTSDFVGERLDETVIETIYELMGQEKYQSLIDMFKSNSEMHLKEIDEILVKKTYAELKAPIHSLKGSSGNIGAPYLAHICLTIEALIVDTPPDEQAITQYVNDIKAEFEYVVCELSKK